SFSSATKGNNLVVWGTGGGDSIFVRRSPTNPAYVEVWVNWQNQYTGLYASLNGIQVNTGACNDYVFLYDPATNVPVRVYVGGGHDGMEGGPTNLATIGAAVTVDGGSGSSTLTVNDQANADTYVMNPLQAPYTFSLTGSSMTRTAYTPWYLGNGTYVPLA